MNTPNKLTVFRMVITPVFLAVLMMEQLKHHFIFGLIIFSIAAITDAIDGHLARKNNQITVFGKLLDPVADKMLTTAALLGFLDMGLCSVWIPLIVLTREFAVTSMRLIASAQGVVVPANIWGKIKTISQMVFTILIMLLGELYTVGILPSGFPLVIISNILLWITAILAVVSGVIYLLESRKFLNFEK